MKIDILPIFRVLASRSCSGKRTSSSDGIAGHAMTFLFMHVLGMASIDDCYCITLDDVGEVPFELCSSLLTLDNAQIRFGIVLAQSQPYRYLPYGSLPIERWLAHDGGVCALSET